MPNLVNTLVVRELTQELSTAEGLVIVSWGGAYEASQEKAYYQPYMKACPNVSTRIASTTRSRRASASHAVRSMEQQGATVEIRA